MKRALPLWLTLLSLSACEGPGAGTGGLNPGGGSGAEGEEGGGEEGGTDDTGGDEGGGDDTGVIDPPVDEVLTQRPAVVLFIGDGMGPEHVKGGGLLANGVAGSLTMETAPNQGWIRTASYTGYTDSAASATAYATGEKTWNGIVGMDRSVESVPNIMERARAAGLATGVVTTDELAGATPSSFVVHGDSRYDKVALADDWLLDMPDLAYGGGFLLFEPRMLEAAIPYFTTLQELEAEAGSTELPRYGMFADIIFPFVADGYEETQPSLAQMVEDALTRLEADPEGFILMVEGARIDHASHYNKADAVHHETVAFDQAIEVALAHRSTWTDRDATILVTADHECGGILVGEAGEPGEPPETSWRWSDHTNADVPVYGWGNHAEALHGDRFDNTYLHTVLEGALFTDTVAAPVLVELPEGELSDLGEPIVTQTWDTDFGAGFTQLDGLRLTSDDTWLKIGIDGVFNDFADAVMVWLDLDFGASTGAGADLVLTDLDGTIDAMLAGLAVDAALPGLGFDAALGNIEGSYLRLGSSREDAGLRLFFGDRGPPEDIWWMNSIINVDSGNFATTEAAPDALATGLTQNGMELWVPWESLYGEEGVPAEGAKIAVFAHAMNTSLTQLSNQALPPWPTADTPDASLIPVASVVVLEVDASGVPMGEATLAP